MICDLIWFGLQVICDLRIWFVIWLVILDIDLNHFFQIICDLDLWFDLWFAYHWLSRVKMLWLVLAHPFKHSGVWESPSPV